MPDYANRITPANQRALITGASRGLGTEIAAEFTDLVLTSRDGETTNGLPLSLSMHAAQKHRRSLPAGVESSGLGIAESKILSKCGKLRA